jgi:hypothetical protein
MSDPPDYRDRSSFRAGLDLPVTISLLDEDGDIAFADLNSNKARINYEDRIYDFDGEHTDIEVQRESTLYNRVLYAFTSSLLAPEFLKGYGELGATIPADGGGGSAIVYQDTPTSDPQLMVTIT